MPTLGSAGTSVTIDGANLDGATAVAFNGAGAASVSVVSSARLIAVVPAGATTGPVSVTTPGGVATSAVSFVVLPGPGITSFSPTAGPFGTTVRINGANLAGASAVSFAGTAAASFVVFSSTRVDAVVAAGTLSGRVSVTTPLGTATSATPFELPPVVLGFTPTSGGPGTAVTISGQNFAAASGVRFADEPAASFSVVSSTTITAVVPLDTISGRITVTNAAGAGTSAGTFSYLAPPPALTSFTPAIRGVGDSVTLTGTNLMRATAVTSVADRRRRSV